MYKIFGFKGRILVHNVPVPGYCLYVLLFMEKGKDTQHISLWKYKQNNLFYNHQISTISCILIILKGAGMYRCLSKNP